MTTLRVTNLDRAAFLCLIGAELINVEGSYPRFIYFIQVSDKQLKREKYDKRVVYFDYMSKRKWLKRGGGLINTPTDNNETMRLFQMTQTNQGYLLKDVAKITYSKGVIK